MAKLFFLYTLSAHMSIYFRCFAVSKCVVSLRLIQCKVTGLLTLAFFNACFKVFC